MEIRTSKINKSKSLYLVFASLKTYPPPPPLSRCFRKVLEAAVSKRASTRNWSDWFIAVTSTPDNIWVFFPCLTVRRINFQTTIDRRMDRYFSCFWTISKFKRKKVQKNAYLLWHGLTICERRERNRERERECVWTKWRRLDSAWCYRLMRKNEALDT